MFNPGDVVRSGNEVFTVLEDQDLSSWGDMAPMLVNVIDETNGCKAPIFTKHAVLVTPAPKPTAPVGEKFNLYWNSDGESFCIEALTEDEILVLVKNILRTAGEITSIINVNED